MVAPQLRTGLLWLALGAALALGCGPEAPELPPPVEPPSRTAAQDREIRALLLDIAVHRMCDALEGRLVPLPEGDARGAAAGTAPAVGRLEMQRCRARREGERLGLHLEGRGWTWVDERSAGPLATSFRVRGYLRFSLAVDLLGEIDVAYDRRARVATLWLTPRERPVARVTSRGRLPIQAETGWSGLIGRIGQALGGPLDERARPMLESHAATLMASRLRPGVTATANLCTGQLDAVVGALRPGEAPDRPFDEGDRPWLDNQRVLLYPGGIDLAGPYDTSGERLEVDVEVEEGPGVEAQVACRDQAARVLDSFVQERPAFLARARAREVVSGARSASLEVDGAGCELVMLLSPRSSEARAPTRVRLRTRIRGAAAHQLVECGGD